VFRNNKLVFETAIKDTPNNTIEMVECNPHEDPAIFFDAIEMSDTTGETTFLLQPSQPVTINVSSDDDKFHRPASKASHPKPHQYEQWPEEIQKIHEKQQKLKANTCRKCSFAARNLNDLHKHIDSSPHGCMEVYEPKIRCYICNRMFMMVKSKANHVQRDHVDSVQKECHICEQSLRETPRTYENHLRRHFESPTNLCVSLFLASSFGFCHYHLV
jgi:hypothetical protein